MFLPTLMIAWIAVPHLGSERYGVLMTVLSLLGFLNIADLGVGGSLITALSRESGAGDYKRVRELQANGFCITICMALLIFIVALAINYIEIGAYVFKSSSEVVQREGTTAMMTFFCFFGLTLPLTLFSKIQLGLQDGHVANNWQAIASIVNFCSGAAAAYLGLSVPNIICGMMTGTIICGVVNGYLYYKNKALIRPNLASVNWGALKFLLRDSVFYLMLQVVFTVSYTADTLLVARFIGAEQVSVYSLSERLFSIVAVAVSVVTGPLWVAYGDALGRADYHWAIKTLKVSTLRIFFAATAVSVGILVFLGPLIHLLSRGHLVAPMMLGAAMCIWRVVESIGGSISVYMFASHANRIVLITGAISAAISMLCKVMLLPTFGVIVVPIVSCISFLFLSLVPCLVFIDRHMKSSIKPA